MSKSRKPARTQRRETIPPPDEFDDGAADAVVEDPVEEFARAPTVAPPGYEQMAGELFGLGMTSIPEDVERSLKQVEGPIDPEVDFSKVESVADRFDAAIDPDAPNPFEEDELTPPVIDLPTTSEAVDGLVEEVSSLRTRNALQEASTEDLMREVANLREEATQRSENLMQLHTTAEESDANLVMIRTRIEQLEAQLRESEGSRAQAFHDAQDASERLVEIEQRFLASELRGNDLEYEVGKLKAARDALSAKKLWMVIPKHKDGQPAVTRFYVLATNVTNAIERAVRTKTVESEDDIANVVVAIDRIVF